MLHIYPESLMALDRLGDVYNKTGEYDLSIEYYQKFLERQPGNPRVLGIIERIRNR